MNFPDINLGRRMSLEVRMVTAKETVRSLLFRIQEIELNTQMPANEKLSEIKKIQEEMKEVGTEIDIVKKEIILLNTYHVN